MIFGLVGSRSLGILEVTSYESLWFITFLLSLYVSLAFVSDLFTIKEFGFKPLWFILAGGLVVALAFWSSFKMVDINNESE
ncbi:MAG: hypothetical protein R2769_17030 [Saprospiraceae bacterium]